MSRPGSSRPGSSRLRPSRPAVATTLLITGAVSTIGLTGPAAASAPPPAVGDRVGDPVSTYLLAKLRPGATLGRDPLDRPTILLPSGARDAALDTSLAGLGTMAIEPALSRRLARAELASALGLDRWVTIRVPEGSDTPAMAAMLRGFGGAFEVVEFDVVGGVAETLPNDPNFGFQYALRNTGQTISGQVGVPDADIDADAAWDITTGDGSVVIASLDSGVNQHVELTGRVLPGWNVPQQNTNAADGCSSHGTHVAGIAAATGNNGVGIAGVCWNAMILPVVVVNPCSGSEAWVADGLTWATDNGADIANMSLQYSAGTTYLHDAVQYAAAAGVLLVAATGNSNGPVSYPAKWPETIAVAATDNTDQRWASSNFGPEVDICAAGWQVYSLTNTTTYGYKNGTSFAVPQVSGLAALLRAVDGTLTAEELRALIEETVDDIGTPGFDNLTGRGRLNAAAALMALVSPPIAGDLDGDGDVDGADLGLLLGAWGPCADCDALPCPADLDGSCVVDGADLGTTLGNWTG